SWFPGSRGGVPALPSLPRRLPPEINFDSLNPFSGPLMHRISAFTLSLSAICCLAAATRSAGTGVYTKEQAARGKNTYGEVCSKCHGDNLAGGDDAPALAGDEFLKHWNGKSANDLFELVRKTMPTDDPGGLSRRQYADVIA